jgi:hypothetical protein
MVPLRALVKTQSHVAPADKKKAATLRGPLSSPRSPKSGESAGTGVFLPVEFTSTLANPEVTVKRPASDEAGPSGLNASHQLYEDSTAPDKRVGMKAGAARGGRRKRRKVVEEFSEEEEEEEAEWAPPEGSYRAKRRKAKARRACE